MAKTERVVLIMAGGTGGHIFPALSIAAKLQAAGVQVQWLGTSHGMEADLVPKAGIPLHKITVRGVVGKGFFSLLLAPFMLLRAIVQAVAVMRVIKPICVLGMGGYASGPGGIAAWLTRRKLLIHEQNAVPGKTNRILAIFADQILEAFPGTFPQHRKTLYTGNPVRDEIKAVVKNPAELASAGRPLRILILGGSQGANVINELFPQVFYGWKEDKFPEIIHQTGSKYLQATLELYETMHLPLRKSINVIGFIDDMAAKYDWADLMIGRSGASTVCELAVAGLPAIFIPYPHHRDQQQTLNAKWLAEAGAAIIVEQKALTAESIRGILEDLHRNRSKLVDMSLAAQRKAIRQADEVIAAACLGEQYD